MSIELLLYRFCQSNKFRKKNKKSLRTSKSWPHIVPKTCFEGPLWDIPWTSFRNVPGTLEGDVLRTSSVLKPSSAFTPSSLLLLIIFIWSLKNLYWCYGMSVCFFNSLPNGEYWNLLIVVAFPNSTFSDKTSSLVKIHVCLYFLMIEPRS